jgi:hypothetical protein
LNSLPELQTVEIPDLIYDRHNAQVRKISHRKLLGEKTKALDQDQDASGRHAAKYA